MPRYLVRSGGAPPEENVTFAELDADDTDQTASLVAQIAAVPDGTGADDIQTIRLPDGRYRLDGQINFSQRNWLTVEGPTVGTFTGYTDITTDDANRSHWRIVGGSHITLRAFDIEGPNTQLDETDTRFAKYREAYFGQHGVALQSGADHITVEDINITQVYGDFLYIGGVGLQNTNVTMRRIVGRYAGRQAVGIVNVDQFLGEDIDLQWNGRSGFDIEPNHDNHFVWNVTLRRCTMGSQFYPYIIGGAAGDDLEHVHDITFEDCIGLNASSAHTALLANAMCTNITISGHTDLRQRSVQAMTFANTTGTLIVEDCDITSGPSTPTSYGMVLNDVTAAVEIRRNDFSGVGAASTGADELYGVNVNGTSTGVPASITHCGNTWAGGTLNDGAC